MHASAATTVSLHSVLDCGPAWLVVLFFLTVVLTCMHIARLAEREGCMHVAQKQWLWGLWGTIKAQQPRKCCFDGMLWDSMKRHGLLCSPSACLICVVCCHKVTQWLAWCVSSAAGVWPPHSAPCAWTELNAKVLSDGL